MGMLFSAEGAMSLCRSPALRHKVNDPCPSHSQQPLLKKYGNHLHRKKELPISQSSGSIIGNRLRECLRSKATPRHPKQDPRLLQMEPKVEPICLLTSKYDPRGRTDRKSHV